MCACVCEEVNADKGDRRYTSRGESRCGEEGRAGQGGSRMKIERELESGKCEGRIEPLG